MTQYKIKLSKKYICNFIAMAIILSLTCFTFFSYAIDSPSFPLISNLKNSTEDYVGREEFLKNMHAYFFGKEKHHSLVISGSPGAGKTQVIIRFSELHKTNYHIIWWFDLNKDLNEQYRSFAKDWNRLISKHYKDVAEQNFLLINLESIDSDKIKDEVHDRLKSTTLNWLIIFDNVKDSITTLKSLPKHNSQGYGHIIISTQNNAKHKNVMHIDKFSREESIELLIKTTGEDDESKANTLADTLNDYPMAVAKAGRFIAAKATIDMKEYNRLFLTKRQELWDAENALLAKRNDFDDYKRTVSTMLSTNIDEIRTESDMAYELLAVSAFLDNEKIPEELLKSYVKSNHGQERVEIEFKNALSTLMNQSLLIRNYKNKKPVEQDEESLLMTYQIMQQVMQGLLTANEKELYLNKAIIAMNQLLPSNIYLLTNFLSEKEYFISHINSLKDHASDLKLYNNDVLELNLRALEYYLSSLGNNKDAEHLINQIEEISKHLPRQDNLSKLRFSLMCSNYFGGKSDYSSSLKEALIAESLIKQIPSCPEEEILRVYSRLARLYNVMGNNVEAFKFAELAKKIVEKSPTIPGYQNDLDRILVKIYADNGDMVQALKYAYLNAIKLDSKKRVALSDISAHLIYADILIKSAKLKEAKQELDLLAKSIELSLPKEHLYQANIMSYRSYVDAMLGLINSKQAIKTTLAAQEMYKTLLDVGYYKNRHTFMSHKFLGEIYEKDKDYINAEAQYCISLSILNNIYNNSSAATDDISDLIYKLAIISVKLNLPVTAIEYLEKHNQVFGKNHPRSFKIKGYFIDHNVDVGM